MKCEGSMIYTECNTACPRTCDNKEVVTECTTNICIDGCRCPPGDALELLLSCW